MRNSLFKLAVILAISSLTGCQVNNVDFINDYKKSFNEVANRQLILPTNSLRNFSKASLTSDFYTSEYKIICTGYMDCSPCVLRLKECEDFLNSHKELLSKLKLIFIVAGEESDYFTYQVEQNRFSFPILQDVDASFIRNNGLENYDKSVFLLNKRNELLLVGSPFDNDVLEKYYERTILGR